MSAALDKVIATEPSNLNGYRKFKLGKFELSRDEYFVKISWPAKGVTRSHQMSADAFLRACMRDVAWNFFYGWVNFDHVIGTRNHYGRVDMYAGTFNKVLKDAGVDTVKELKYRNPGRLAEAMAAANAKHKRVQLLPSEKRVGHWIEAARKLDQNIKY